MPTTARSDTAVLLHKPPLQQANPAPVIHQMQIMSKAARMLIKQVRYRPPTTAAPLTRSAGLQLPTALLNATLQQANRRR